MKEYKKPTIAIAASTGTNPPVFCYVQADLDLIKDIVGASNIENSFGLFESCKVQIPIEGMCKFTSADMGYAQAFIS